MKTTANRLIVFAVSALALGTAAFGQTRMTAEIPFAFRTVSGTLPAGAYNISDVRASAVQHMVYIQNIASGKGAFAGHPTFDLYKRTTGAPIVEFACVNGDCALRAIRTLDGVMEYSLPKSWKSEKEVAIVNVPLKYSNGD